MRKVAEEPRRPFEQEDLDHLDEAIDTIKHETSAIALPGLESVRRQVKLRLNGQEEVMR